MIDTKWCPLCRRGLPLDSFYPIKGKNHRRSYCRECDSKRSRKRRQKDISGMSPADLFAAYKSWKPENVRAVLEKDGQRVCKTCMEWHLIADFRTSRNKHNARPVVSWECKACHRKRIDAWKAKNPELTRTHQLTSMRRRSERSAFARQALRKLHGVPMDKALDVFRRGLAEHPPELSTEEEKAAYFRGFVAGAKRSREESDRFERLKDLCHRIAAENRSRNYEARVAWAYEGLLAFIRKPTEWPSLDAERKVAAQAIRFYIIDRLRAEGPFGRSGLRRYETDVLSGHVNEKGESLLHPVAADSDKTGGNDLWNELEAVIMEAARGGHVDERLADMLHMRIQGHSMKEIGERMGFTESRACQIMQNHQGWLADKAKKLLGSRWDEISAQFLEVAV